jgi:hypothetical protein
MAAASLTFVFYFIFLASVIWIGVDASKRDFSDSRFASKTWQWVVGAWFLWIIVMPVYLIKRRSAPLKAAS